MEKDFDTWNGQKKVLDLRPVQRSLYFDEREVWWCSLGLNVGVETDGKHEDFERPVLIVKKFNNQMIWILPLTSKERTGAHYHLVRHDRGVSWVCLTQIRTISTKRLLRKIGMISKIAFGEVCEKLVGYITIGPRISAGSSEAEATNK